MPRAPSGRRRKIHSGMQFAYQRQPLECAAFYMLHTIYKPIYICVYMCVCGMSNVLFCCMPLLTPMTCFYFILLHRLLLEFPFRFSPHFQVELFIVAAALMSFQGGSGCIQSVYLILPSQTPRCCLIFGFYATLARSPPFRLWPLPPTKPTPTNPLFSPISINSCWVAIAIVIERASPAHFIFPISLCHSKSAFFPSLSPSWFVPHASGLHGNSFSYRQRKSTRMGLAISRIC